MKNLSLINYFTYLELQVDFYHFYCLFIIELICNCGVLKETLIIKLARWEKYVYMCDVNNKFDNSLKTDKLISIVCIDGEDLKYFGHKYSYIEKYTLRSSKYYLLQVFHKFIYQIFGLLATW